MTRREWVTGIFLIAVCVGAIFFFRSHLRSNLELSDSNKAKGSLNSPVEIIEYSNFECHSCRDIQPFIDELLRKYPGKVRMVFRHYPSYGTQFSLWSHVAAECAAQKGLFWPYHDKLFENQKEWSISPRPIKYFIQYAAELGIDKVEFEKCLTDESIIRKVREEDDSGLKLGLRVTPSFIINGEIIVGQREFKEKAGPKIESELKRRELSL